MKSFEAAFLNEIEKLYRKKKATVVVIISILMIVIGQLMVSGVRSGFGLRTASGTDFPMLVLSVFVNTLLPLFTALVTIEIFTSEFSNNTMKIAVSKPITKFKLFSAKISAIAFFIIANLMLVMILSLITGIAFNFSSVTISGVFNVILSYVVVILPVLTLALIIAFLSNILKSGTAVFFLSVLIFLAFKALPLIFPRYAILFITSRFDWYNLWIAFNVPFVKILRELIFMLGLSTVFFTAGYYLFEKKDL